MPVEAIEEYSALTRSANTYGYTSERKRAEIEVLFRTGLRLAEMAFITLDGIQGDTMTVIGKGKKVAMVFLPESVGKAFAKYIKVRRLEGSNRVFINSKGDTMTYDGIRSEICKVAEKAGIKFSPTGREGSMQGFSSKKGLTLKR
ncbi:MAG: tyrosine-type recombinase/integrase [Thermoplasmatales archaeon]